MEPTTSNKPRAPRFSVGGLSDEYHPRRLALALSPSKFWESDALLSETTGGNDSTMNPLHYQDNRTHQYGGGNAVAAKGASSSVPNADFQNFQTEPPVAISTISNDGGIQTMDRRGLKLLKAADVNRNKNGDAYPYSSTVKEARVSKSDESLSIADDDDDDHDDDDDDDVDDDEKDEDYEDLPHKLVRSKSKNVKTSESGSYLNHEGIPYMCSSVKNGIAKYRCYLYLPSGTSVTSQDAQWTRYQAARDKSPLGVKLQRCSGAISVNQVDNTITITTAHECTCTLATTATEKSGRGGVVARASPPLIAAAMNSNDKVLPKTGSHLLYGGVPYICSGTTNGVSRFRCFLYRPTNAVTMATVWTDHAKAKKQNGGVKPYRCPGTMILDNNKDEGYVLDVAHECGRTFVADPALGGENEGCTASNSSLVRHRAEPMNSASTATSHRGDIVRKMNDRASIAKSSACTRSSRVSNMKGDHESGDDSSAVPGSTNDTALGQQELGQVNADDNASKKYMNIQGIPYHITNQKGIEKRCRCLRYLPHGISVTAQDAKWFSCYPRAKEVNPDGTPHRCPGVVIVNQKTNERKVVVPHECPAPELTAESVAAGVTCKTSSSLALTFDDECEVGASSAASHEAANGGANDCVSTNIFDTSLDVSDDTRIGRFDGCVLEGALECGHTFGSSMAKGKEGRCMATSHRGGIVRHMNDRASIAKSSAHTRSSRDGQPQAMHQIEGPMDRTLARDEMKSEVPGLADFEHTFDDDDSNDDISLASDNEGVNSVASDKSYYKGLCAQLTEALTTRKNENKEFKQENKALRKENKALRKENTDVNSRLSNAADYKRKNKRLKKENADLQEEIRKRRSDNNEYKLKNKRLKKENKGLKEKLAEISENNNYNHRRMERHTCSSFSAKYA